MKRIFLGFLVTMLAFMAFAPVAQVQAADSRMLISEIKLGGAVEGEPTQFVELYNDSPNVIDLSGWSLEYAKKDASISTAQCQEPIWENIDDNNSIKSYNLSGLIQSKERIAFDDVLLNDKAAGSLRLTNLNEMPNPTITIYDLVGWGDDEAVAKCYETIQTVIPPNGQSIKRIFNDDNKPVDTDNNAADFSFTGQDPLPEENDPDDPPDTFLQIEITELLPDPSSPLSDAKNEFIELYNPNDSVVNLAGYIVETGLSNQYSYVLPDVLIDNKGFYVIYSGDSGLTLSNSSSQARILSPDNQVLYSTDPYESSEEDSSWAYVNSRWVTTDRVTPGAENLSPTKVFQETGGKNGLTPCSPDQFRNPATNRCKKISSSTTLKPCNSDQFRNPATNRCKKIGSDSTTLKPCSPDQFRNPATNRCKKISSTNSSLKPCNADQFRNPETNRCKKINSSDGLKPCDDGYERNKDTNRCRKVAGASTGSGFSDVASTASNPVSYPALALVSSGVLGYGFYEYKHEISKLTRRLRRKS